MFKFRRNKDKEDNKGKEQQGQQQTPSVTKLSQKVQDLAAKASKVSTKKKKENKKSWATLTSQELQENYDKLKSQYRDLRFKLVTSSLSKNHQVSVVKKDIARILTYINKYKSSKKEMLNK